MYKRLFILLYELIVHPESAWKGLSGEQDDENRNSKNEEFYKSYLYPVFGLIALFAFAGVLISLKQFDVPTALKTVIREFLTYALAFYASAWSLQKLLASYFHFPSDRFLSERFVGYASSVIYVTAFLTLLFPSFFFIQFLTLYLFYVVWQGTLVYLRLEEKIWAKFTIFAGILIIAMPELIRLIISLIMPGLK